MLDKIGMNRHRSLRSVYGFRLVDAILSLPGVNWCKFGSELLKIVPENHILSRGRTLKCLWMAQTSEFFFFFKQDNERRIRISSFQVQ